jgi:drug/metabolite transporter (DMT)-like permease
MTPGLPLALGAMACFGVSDIIYKRGAAAGIKAGDFLMLQAWVFCPGVTLYAWLSGNLDPHLSAVSTNAPIFRLNFTITAALAILLLHEPFTAAKAIALACALVAV